MPIDSLARQPVTDQIVGGLVVITDSAVHGQPGEIVHQSPSRPTACLSMYIYALAYRTENARTCRDDGRASGSASDLCLKARRRKGAALTAMEAGLVAAAVEGRRSQVARLSPLRPVFSFRALRMPTVEIGSARNSSLRVGPSTARR